MWLKKFFLFYYLPVLGAVGGCSTLPEEMPPVSDSTMVEVLIDFQLAQARIALLGDQSLAVRDSIISQHGVSQQDYELTVQYYAQHPDRYLDISTSVLDRLNAERGHLSTSDQYPDKPSLPPH